MSGNAPSVPPLTCALCWAPRWNDESVVWLPLRMGMERRPYCAQTCGVWVMTDHRAVKHGGAEVWAALNDYEIGD